MARQRGHRRNTQSKEQEEGSLGKRLPRESEEEESEDSEVPEEVAEISENVSKEERWKKRLEKIEKRREGIVPIKMKPRGEEKEEEIKKIQVEKGSVPVDEYVQDREQYNVFKRLGKDYSKMLACSDVSSNSNKFYLIQLLEKKSDSTYYTFYRWGRIGYPGTMKLNAFGTSSAQAILDYDQKLALKTADTYYREVKVVYGEEADPNEDPDKKMQEAMEDFNLGPKVSELIKSLFSIKMFTEQVQEIGYDVKKMPLGKLSTESLKTAGEILKQIKAVIEKNPKDKSRQIENLSSNFFEIIPHDIKAKKLSEFALYTTEKVQEKEHLLELLTNMKFVGTGGSKSDENPIEMHYRSLHTEVKELDETSNVYKLIRSYADTNIAPMHNSLKIKIDTIFSLVKESENKNFDNSIGNNTLLFHGSRLTNMAGILSKGLQVPASETAMTGMVFGKGIYFTDVFSKAVLQCQFHLSNGVCYVVVSEVALGASNEMFSPDSGASSLPFGTKSTKGCGRIAPEGEGKLVSIDGSTKKVKVPEGKLVETEHRTSLLQFNEFVVYDNSQVRMRYLIKCTAGK